MLNDFGQLIDIVSTPMTADVPNDDKYVLVAPLKRKGTPQEVADAALFLCSSKATFIQGAGLVSLYS